MSPAQKQLNLGLNYLPSTSASSLEEKIKTPHGLCPGKTLFSTGIVAHYPAGVRWNLIAVCPVCLRTNFYSFMGKHTGKYDSNGQLESGADMRKREGEKEYLGENKCNLGKLNGPLRRIEGTYGSFVTVSAQVVSRAGDKNHSFLVLKMKMTVEVFWGALLLDR